MNFNTQFFSIAIKTSYKNLYKPSALSLCFQTADAVYDAKYKQLAASPGCRKPGLQELMQYEMNT